MPQLDFFDVPEPDLLAGRHADRDLFHPQQDRLAEDRLGACRAARARSPTILPPPKTSSVRPRRPRDAYNKALADARAEAQRIAEETRAEIQAVLAEATAKADEQIAAKATESEARIAEIQANATQSVEDVARDVAGDVVAAVMPGQTVDADTVASAVTARMKG